MYGGVDRSSPRCRGHRCAHAPGDRTVSRVRHDQCPRQKPPRWERGAQLADRAYRRALADGALRWDAVVHIPNPATGKRKKVQKTFQRERDAKRWVTEQQGAINNGTAVLPNAMSVSELMAY